jgi:hypothetical protein
MDEARFEELLAKQEVRDVIHRYCRGVDRMDEALVRSCYHPDATDEHGSFSGGVDDYIAWAWKLLARYDSTMHYVANVLVEPEGDVARAESYGIAFHQTQGGPPEHNLVTGFRFIDRFECRDGTWRIATRVATTEWVRRLLPEADWPIVETLRRGARDRSDPVYE